MLNVEEINCLLFMKHFFKFLPKKVLLLILVQLNSYLSPAHQMISIVKSILFQMSLFLGVWISPSCLSYPIYAIKECYQVFFFLSQNGNGICLHFYFNITYVLMESVKAVISEDG